MENFQELKAWQRSKDLAASFYEITGQRTFDKDWRLRGTMGLSDIGSI